LIGFDMEERRKHPRAEVDEPAIFVVMDRAPGPGANLSAEGAVWMFQPRISSGAI